MHNKTPERLMQRVVIGADFVIKRLYNGSNLRPDSIQHGVVRLSGRRPPLTSPCNFLLIYEF